MGKSSGLLQTRTQPVVNLYYVTCSISGKTLGLCKNLGFFNPVRTRTKPLLKPVLNTFCVGVRPRFHWIFEGLNGICEGASAENTSPFGNSMGYSQGGYASQLMANCVWHAKTVSFARKKTASACGTWSRMEFTTTIKLKRVLENLGFCVYTLGIWANPRKTLALDL